MTRSNEYADEDAWTAALAAAASAGPFARLGIGDDAAWTVPSADGWLVATDVLIDGAHAEVSRDGAAALAFKSIGVNVSDIAAMGGRPRLALVGLVLPRRRDRAMLDAVRRGLLDALVAYDVALIGGDTNVADGPLTLAVTVLGTPGRSGVLTRSGARVGDRLSVTGPLGGSRAGRHLRPVSRVAAGEILAASGLVHAAMDISDGLARDLPRLARASRVGARVHAESVPIHDDVPRDVPERLARALGDGEDFELLVAHAPLDATTLAALAAEGVHPHEIGVVVEASDGLTLSREGRERSWPAGGHDHLAVPRPESPSVGA